MKLLVIYHGNCADGFTSAWAIWKKYPDAEFHAGVHGSEPPTTAGKVVVMVDFSYKKDAIDEMAKTAKSILILDHHKSAAEELSEFPEPPQVEGWCGWLPESGVYATFDMNRSGARITWDHFHGTEPGLLVHHVEDRDLWNFSMVHTKSFQANVFSYEYTFENWEMIDGICADESKYESFIEAGQTLERKHLKDVKELIEVCQRTLVIGGYEVPAASLPYTMSSDAGHIMSEGKPFAACYWDTKDDRIFSLRSAEDGVDVSEIAKQYGGGGHKHAAGFKVGRLHMLAQG